MGVLGLVTQQAFSQATQPDNNGGFGSFLGWNAGANQTLEVKNEANQPIEWYTDAVQRMRLMPTLTGQTVNGYTGLNLSGHLGLGGPVPTRPLAYIHINSSGGLFTGYRPWMDNGITFTTNSDQLYVGHKVESGSVQSSAVIRKQRLRRPRSVADVYAAVGWGSMTDTRC